MWSLISIAHYDDGPACRISTFVPDHIPIKDRRWAPGSRIRARTKVFVYWEELLPGQGSERRKSWRVLTNHCLIVKQFGICGWRFATGDSRARSQEAGGQWPGARIAGSGHVQRTAVSRSRCEGAQRAPCNHPSRNRRSITLRRAKRSRLGARSRKSCARSRRSWARSLRPSTVLR